MSTASIVPYLAARYNMEGDVTLETLEAAQKSFLYSEIKNKTPHEKLYRAASNELVDIQRSALWLTHGSISANHEARLSYLQDRSLFGTPSRRDRSPSGLTVLQTTTRVATTRLCGPSDRSPSGLTVLQTTTRVATTRLCGPSTCATSTGSSAASASEATPSRRYAMTSR